TRRAPLRACQSGLRTLSSLRIKDAPDLLLRESDRALFVQLFVTREFALVELQGADYSTALDSIWLLQPQRYCVESTLSAMGWHFSSLPVTSSLTSKTPHIFTAIPSTAWTATMNSGPFTWVSGLDSPSCFSP